MTTQTLAPRQVLTALPFRTAALFAAGAVAFNVGGALHPNDDGRGDKAQQLHDMLLKSTWYPAHVGLLLSFALFTLAFAACRRLPLSHPTRRVLRGLTVVSAVTTVAMVPHLLAPLGADHVVSRHSPMTVFMTIDETLVDAPWALGVAVLAVVAGLAADLGNRISAVLGLVGGVCFALAAVTIPFVDTFDGLFPVGGMGITLWALSVALVGLLRRPRR